MAEDHDNFPEHESSVPPLTAHRLDRIGGRNAPQRASDSGVLHSKIIRKAKLILPLLGVIILAIVFTWPSRQNPIVKTEAPSMEELDQAARNELLNPRFESKDDKQQPYTISAKRAFQDDPSNKAMIRLEAPFADIMLSGENWLAGEAKTGLYNQDTQDLNLSDGVRLFHDDGYEVKMQDLALNLKAGTANTAKPVTGSGPGGELEAMGMEADNVAGRLILKGPARVILRDVQSSALAPAALTWE